MLGGGSVLDLDTNAGGALDVLIECGYAVKIVKVDPMKIGLPISRPRIKIVTLHVEKYAKSQGWIPEADDNRTRVQFFVDDWAGKIEAIFDLTHPDADLHHFLLPDGHELLRGMSKALNKKVEDMLASAAVGRKRKGRDGTGWIRCHETEYKKAKIEWSCPTSRSVNYNDNEHFHAMPIRERDVILFWDATDPVDGSCEVELATSLSIIHKLHNLCHSFNRGRTIS